MTTKSSEMERLVKESQQISREGAWIHLQQKLKAVTFTRRTQSKQMSLKVLYCNVSQLTSQSPTLPLKGLNQV